MPSLNKLLQWLILTLLFPLIFLNIWLAFRVFRYFQPLVTILVLACLLAFILNYPVSLLQQRGIKRNYAIALVLISTVVILAALGITLVPIALQQFSEMTKVFPQWIDSSEQNLQIFSDRVFGNKFNINLRQIFSQLINQLPNEAEQIGDKLFSIVVDTIDGISEALITVVLTVYLLIDGERIWEGIFKKLPLGFTQKIQQSLQQNFQNYLIGQVSLALLMGVSQTVMFLVLNVRFGLLFGLGIGILSLIPFGDVVSLAIITLIIAFHNFWLAVKVLVVAVIIDQLIDQAIAPRLLGSFTGIRPIWVIVSLLVGTYLGGVLGLLIAVPVAGFIKDATDGFVTTSANTSNQIESEELPEMLANESSLH
ncbi:AI-2E family transporter [Chlorogloeopsis fritschii PCC 9212]|uniref:AI-2E family transporter n=1 Tax=Chlorogloeopsis fritschii PCC 6912 TaxID=211165 RepID=A0A433N2Z6_CHLFR|nr:AI-2E family transporter [Chlorogloeopsis fritschii]RUR75523.1 AI-2E family transporter [Chlorogloeopsis fritschii PCC 6912]